MKRCKKCDKSLSLSSFTKCSANRDGYEYKCKICRSEARKKYYSYNKTKVLAKNKQYYEINKDKIQKKNKIYWDDKYKNNTEFRIACVLRRRLNGAIRTNASAVENLGCTIKDLRKHLESKFTEGMSWDNYGKWHVDHIRPLSSYDLSDKIELEKACHYTNLQPLWAKDNLCKNNKILIP